jgi:phage tail sheath gpL-like
MTIDFVDIIPQTTPDVQVETDWSGAAAGLPADVKKVLLLGNNLSTGTEPVPATTDVAVVRRITSEAKAIALWGKGSNLAIMARAAIEVSPKVELYGAPYKQGSGAAKAACETTLSVTATGNGTLYLWACGELFTLGVSTGDTPAIVAAAMVALVNGHTNFPLLASVASTTHIKLEARQPGTVGNFVGFKYKITSGIGMLFQTPAMGAASVESAEEFCTGGTVDGDPTVQLAAMEGTRFHIIALDTADSTALGKIKTHLNKVSGPAYKKWGMGVCGYNGTLANCETLANAQDAYRIQVFFVEKCPQHPAIMAAKFACLRGRYGAKESLIGKEVVGLAQPYSLADALDPAEIEEALDEGITPGRCSETGGRVEVVRSVTTRQTATIAFRDHCIQEKSDYFDESLVNGFAPYIGRTLKVASDPGSNSTMTLGRLTAILNRIIFALDKTDYVQGTKDAIAAGSNWAEVNATDADRVDVACRFYPTRILAFLAIQKSYYTGA